MFIILILLLYNVIAGYLNGNEGFFQKTIQKFYWSIPILFIFLLYIIINKNITLKGVYYVQIKKFTT